MLYDLMDTFTIYYYYYIGVAVGDDPCIPPYLVLVVHCNSRAENIQLRNQSYQHSLVRHTTHKPTVSTVYSSFTDTSLRTDTNCVLSAHFPWLSASFSGKQGNRAQRGNPGGNRILAVAAVGPHNDIGAKLLLHTRYNDCQPVL